MREILFRGKRVDNGELVVGNSVLFFKDTTKIYGELTYWREIEVIPETVGQYTGLTDKNGEKIFEGDIIAKGFERYEVKWNAEQMRWGIYSDNYEVAGFTKFSEPYFEVIGNLYDNPKLLRSENE